jgi:carboxymethylenebutenolidase
MAVATQSGIETKTFTCANGMPVFLARPAAAGKRPVVVLMHERYGLVAHTQDLAVRCARDGFFVMAPNFFFRHPDQAQLNAGDSRYDISDPESVELLQAALEAVRADAGADLGQVAVAGYCQTGRHPLVFAAHVPIAAAIVWYGAASKREWEPTKLQPEPLDAVIARVPCPVFGAFGTDDHIISVEDVRRFRDALETHKKSYDIHLYHGAPHGWLNDTMPGRYRRAQAEQAWADQQRFLKAVLGDGYPRDRVLWRFESEVGRDYDFSKNKRLE